MSEPKPANPTYRNLALIATGVVIAAGALRLWAAWKTLFWLDEVLTLVWPKDNSYWQLLTAAKHDNNHVLNSMFMRLIGEPGHWFWYRLLSVLTGTIAVACMGRIGWRRSPAEGLIATLLGAVTYVLIHYATEARGYGPLVCFALLSYLTIDRASRHPGIGISIAFWTTAILGVLSHSTYAFAYIGLAAWSFVVWFPSNGQQLRRLLTLHAIPVLVLATVYFGRIRGMAIGGGPEFDLMRVFINALSHCVGWRYGNWHGDAVALLVIAVAAVEIALRFRERPQDRSSVFFGSMLLATPLLILFVLKPSIIYMRYVVVCVPFILLLMSGALARLWHLNRGGKLACVALLGGIVILNATRVSGLLRAGRGQYLKALQYIETHDPAPVLEITGNNHLHVGRILDYYRRFIDKPVTYANPKTWRGKTPRWLIHDIQRFEKRPAPGESLTSDTGWGRYVCVARFHYNSQSGANWYVFEHNAYR